MIWGVLILLGTLIFVAFSIFCLSQKADNTMDLVEGYWGNPREDGEE